MLEKALRVLFWLGLLSVVDALLGAFGLDSPWVYPVDWLRFSAWVLCAGWIASRLEGAARKVAIACVVLPAVLAAALVAPPVDDALRWFEFRFLGVYPLALALLPFALLMAIGPKARPLIPVAAVILVATLLTPVLALAERHADVELRWEVIEPLRVLWQSIGFFNAAASVVLYAALRHAATVRTDDRDRRLASLGFELFVAASLVALAVKVTSVFGGPLSHSRSHLMMAAVVVGLTQVAAFVLIARARSLGAVRSATLGGVCVALSSASDLLTAYLYGTFTLESWYTPLLLGSIGGGALAFVFACNTVRDVAQSQSAYEVADGARIARNVIFAAVAGTVTIAFVMPPLVLAGAAVAGLAALGLLRSAWRLSRLIAQPPVPA